ncbi:MAG: hypothetical protein K0U66_05130 [Gammaproteobacteria bacterium]|nr:hypothetical protein [Pseudomonadota bacterium]MCH9663022.1 hypothetical protein [Gammaproteobacteria bacterium]
MEEIKQLLSQHRRAILKGAIFAVPFLTSLIMATLSLSDLESYHHQPSVTPVAADLLAQLNDQGQSDPTSRAIAPIFGRFDSAADKAALAASNIPTTSLNLTLHAIFYSTDPKVGSALISKQGRQKATIYNIGKPIMRGVKLEKVFINSVIIDRNGNSESLRLPRLGKDSSNERT